GPDTVGIVVTDLEMDRGMGGEGLIKSIRSDARFSSLPILVYSGMLDEHRIKEVLEYGATDTADKGNPQDLVDKINLHARTR
ncbi:MAG: response regulator, partial [Patescibacteria group bacterium]